MVAAAVATGLIIGFSHAADALPSFARQTGQPCGACHTDYPGLTPYGRLFKLNGYTAGGGRFRTTLLPLPGQNAVNALAAYARGIDGGSATSSPPTGKETAINDGTRKIWVPPIAMMAVLGYTHTRAPQDPADVAPYNPNDNFTMPQLSLFWGGAITRHIGAFSQWTYDGRSAWGWDNQDFRYSNTATLGSMNVIYGISADNNPTMGDPWNTAPAWRFPYMDAGDPIMPGPAASTLLDGGLAQAVAEVGAYGYFNNLVYLQFSGYRSIDPRTLGWLGAAPADVGRIDGVAPYWRAAIEPHWGRHWLELGTFGTYASINPWSNPDTFTPYGGANHYTDIALDSQYQYQGDNYWLTLRGTYIHEYQALGASALLADSTHSSDTLNTTRLYSSLAYGNKNRIVLSGQYFNIWGSSDPELYADNPGCSCSPNSNGYVAELSYIPFINSNSPGWPWANVRVGLQYTYYNKLDGTSTGAKKSNTLFLYAWFAM